MGVVMTLLLAIARRCHRSIGAKLPLSTGSREGRGRQTRVGRGWRGGVVSWNRGPSLSAGTGCVPPGLGSLQLRRGT